MCLCDACLERYNAVKNYYDKIKDYENQPNVQNSSREKECEDLLFRDDGVEAVESVYNLVMSLWDGADCSCELYKSWCTGSVMHTLINIVPSSFSKWL